jgi:glycosyltransferase involved in cell wall biosynthesis
VIIRSQSKVGRSFWRGISPSVDLHVEVGNVADPAALYADADVLVLPRRYGGLCLPAQEAMSCGLPVLMTDCPPNDYYAARDAWIPSRQSDTLRMQGGMIPCFEANPRAIASMIDRLYNDDGWVAGLAGWSRMRADALSWEAQERQWRDALDEAAAVLV